MTSATIGVEGMSCGHCKATIETNLSSLDGVENITVDLKQKQVTVLYDKSAVDIAAIKQVIAQQGFTVVD